MPDLTKTIEWLTLLDFGNVSSSVNPSVLETDLICKRINRPPEQLSAATMQTYNKKSF